MNLTRYRSTTWVLVMYLSFSLLTSCTKVGVEIIDPTEPAKLATPLINSLGLNVALKFGTGSAHPDHDKDAIAPGFPPDFLNAMKQRLIDSGATLTVQPQNQCEPGSHERTVCITATIFNYDRSFFDWMKLISKGVIIMLGVWIPVFFMTWPFQDQVIAETVVLDKHGKEIARFKTQSDFVAYRRGFAILHAKEFYFINNKELSNRIVRELAKHPHWFRPAPTPAS